MRCTIYDIPILFQEEERMMDWVNFGILSYLAHLRHLSSNGFRCLLTIHQIQREQSRFQFWYDK